MLKILYTAMWGITYTAGVSSIALFIYGVLGHSVSHGNCMTISIGLFIWAVGSVFGALCIGSAGGW